MRDTYWVIKINEWYAFKYDIGRFGGYSIGTTDDINKALLFNTEEEIIKIIYMDKNVKPVKVSRTTTEIKG